MRGRAVAAACLATTLAACGGGERQASPLERWRQQADAACDRAEKAIREGGRPTSPDDLERVVVRVGDIAIETAGEIRGLKAPEGERARIAPLLEQLRSVRRQVAAVRRAAASDDLDEVGRVASGLRLDGGEYARGAEKAGLKRCGRRELSDALVDELLTPAFVASTAVAQARLDEQVTRLRRFLAATPAHRPRADLWEQMREIFHANRYSTTSMPERLEKVEDRFILDEGDTEEAIDAAAFHLRSGSTAKARRAERKALKGLAQMRAQTRAYLKASGPAGAEALDRLEAEQRGTGGSGS